MKFDGIIIGAPREIMSGEKRAAVVPATVSEFIKNGARVLVESGIGKGAFWEDENYAEAGAEVVSGPREVYGGSNLVLKVKEPLFNDRLGQHEAEMVSENSTLVCFLHPANPANHEMVRILADRKVVGYTLDGVPRISRAQRMDALTAMSTVAGYKAVLFAAEHLPRFMPMMPTASGVIKPAVFLVVGAGIAGLQAIATARRLGAKVKAIDIRAEANEQAKSLGAEVIPFDAPEDLCVGKDGYARRLPDEWNRKERELIAEHLKDVDAVILTALIPGEQAPTLVDEAMVGSMKDGSVIMDIAIDQGGNCGLTEAGETRLHGNTLIGGIKNMPARLPVDATWMFSQCVMHFLDYIVQEGSVRTDTDDEIVKGALVTIGGDIVHGGTLQAMGQARRTGG